MKTINQTLAMGLALSLTTALTAAGGEGHDHGSNPDLFRANELSLDLFGTGSVGQETIDHISGHRVEHNGRLGAGAGLNYFFTRNFGLGADAYTENTGDSFVDNTSVNLIARLPLGASGFAPYIFGGATRQFDPERQWGADAGGGFELRFTAHCGVFVDARYVFADETHDYGVGRAGLRISF